MDDDGFAVQGRRRRGTHHESARNRDRATFLRDVPKYEGTPEDFDRAHYQRYGREEGLGPDGKHHHGSFQFPQGSDRQKLYDQYDVSTKGRDKARDAYKKELTAAKRESRSMNQDEQRYYADNTGGLPPHRHERLDPRATVFREKSWSNARNREIFQEQHPHGYHSAQSQIDHHDYATRAYGEYEYARDQQEHHERYRSYSNVDKRRDKYGRPVAHH